MNHTYVKENPDTSVSFLPGLVIYTHKKKSYYSTLVKQVNAQKNKKQLTPKNLGEQYDTTLHQDHGYKARFLGGSPGYRKPQLSGSSLILDGFE